MQNSNNNSDIYDDIYDPLITETGDSYRDSIATIDKRGKRIWVYPHKPKGSFHRWRLAVGYFLVAILIIMPFLRIKGHPFLLLNIIERKFFIFGIPFWPQDFYILALSFLSLLVFIVLFTAVFGRIWCGWACPQTVFLELVFRKIEYWLEGDAPEQRKMNNSPMTGSKFLKKSVKNILFFGISFFVGNVFLSYIIGTEQIFRLVSEPPTQHLVGLMSMIFFSLLFFGVFARFRENACIYVCPYGRLQSVLLDKNSIVVAYDNKRGEPRGRIKKNSELNDKNLESSSNSEFKIQNSELKPGDCIDCGMCVRVCPTGIDIRNGTQLECVNCTACIDACDSIMERVKRPKKLIKYGSVNQIDNGLKFKITPRIILYSSVLTVLLFVVGLLIMNMTDIETSVLRAKGTIYQRTAEGNITNLYTGQVVNKTYEKLKLHMNLENETGKIRLVGMDDIIIEPEQMKDLQFFIELPKERIKTLSTKLKLGLYNESGERLELIKTSFVGPVNK